MKRISAILLALCLLVTPALAAGSGTGQASYQNRTVLTDGLTYENAVSYTSDGSRVETYTLEAAAGGSVHPIVLACDTIYGGMTVTQMIAYARTLGYSVVGAVNADFGYWETRIPCGMVVEDGVYKSSPEGNNAVAFTDGGLYASFNPQVKLTLRNETTGADVSLTHYNKTRAETGGLYLYSEYFSTVSTRTATDGWFVRLKVLSGAMSVSGTMELEVTELTDDRSSVPIGAGYLVLTAAKASALESVYGGFTVGDRVTLTAACSDEKLAGAKWVSGCGNILVSEGKTYHSEWWDASVSGVNPRTAVGVRADGTVVYEVMDGRTSASRGATLAELTADLISQGCVTAVNLDGGGSSVMSLLMPGGTDCAVLNSPSDGSLRKVCSYILFVTDQPASGAASRLFLKEDGAAVLSGSSLPLTCLATNTALRTVSLPGTVTASASLGTVSGGVYTAGGAGGADTVRLSAGGISGSGTLHVVTQADSLKVTDAATGKAPAAAAMEQGATLSLSAKAFWLQRPVAMDASAVTYSVQGEVGSVTSDGVFTASGTPGAEGSVTVSAAGVTVQVPVKLVFEFSDVRGHWASAYVHALYEKGVVTGVTDTTYCPDAGMKRCDFVLMLWRAAGQPAASAACTFPDVPADAYYAAAAAWAQEQGIAQGDGNGRFLPEGSLTRQEGFTFLFRALGALGVTAKEADASALAGFSDAAALADWAQTPAQTLCAMGLVDGSGGALDPLGTLTRAQMAKLLCAALKL